ncbi:MAG: diaminopimelate epimerase [Verrucomicrobiota bacterium]
MNGAGNDFVVVDNRDNSLTLNKEQIELICNRQRGVGADGFLAVEPPQNGADYRMRYYNADGGEAEMCGNGARCFARFVSQLEGGSLTETSFETIAGVIHAEVHGDQIKVQLSEPFDFQEPEELELVGQPFTVHSLNTGVPHAVIFVEDLSEVDIVPMGAAARYHDFFAPAGTNVNFVQILSPGKIKIRTYERGVENETLACGTGMVACSIVHHEISGRGAPIQVEVAGGDTLEVDFEDLGDHRYRNVTLFGPADFTFEGVLPQI